jgi:thioredoxin 1
MVDLIKSLFGKKEDGAPAGQAVIEAVVASAAEPVPVTDESFQELILDAQVPAMVDFWAPWCGPCRMVAPIVENLAQTYGGRALIAKMNTDENPQTPSSYGILGIPTLILFKGGQEVDRIVGFAPQNALEARLQALLGEEG